jgi:hypothetical protein
MCIKGLDILTLNRIVAKEVDELFTGKKTIKGGICMKRRFVTEPEFVGVTINRSTKIYAVTLSKDPVVTSVVSYFQEPTNES